MKTSVVIPSTNNHFKYLDKVFLSYVDQTMRPEEIVVSIANGHLVDKEEIRRLKNKYSWYFQNVEIITHDRAVPEGPNRGEGTKIASNDLILYNDSDDLAHPQRVETVKQIFENFDVLHLNHGYSFEERFQPIKQIKTVTSSEMFNLYFPDFLDTPPQKRTRATRPKKVYDKRGNSLPYGSGFGVSITGGSLCILKSVTDAINWEWDMDVSYDYDFCMDTLFYFNKSLLIDSKLIWYNKTGNMGWYI